MGTFDRIVYDNQVFDAVGSFSESLSVDGTAALIHGSMAQYLVDFLVSGTSSLSVTEFLTAVGTVILDTDTEMVQDSLAELFDTLGLSGLADIDLNLGKSYFEALAIQALATLAAQGQFSWAEVIEVAKTWVEKKQASVIGKPVFHAGVFDSGVFQTSGFRLEPEQSPEAPWGESSPGTSNWTEEN